MNRAQKYLSSLPEGTSELKTPEIEIENERIFKSPDGMEHPIPESLLFSNDVT